MTGIHQTTTAPRVAGDTLKFGSKSAVRDNRRGVSTRASRREYSRKFRRAARVELRWALADLA